MGRWTDMDSDAERLPSGFERVGYDADTQTYSFRDSDGNMYESEPGNRYGELHPVGPLSRQTSSDSIDSFDKRNTHSAQTFDEIFEEPGYALRKGNREAVRMMMPFALIVLVFLILVFKLLSRSDGESLTAPKESVNCDQGSHEIQIEQGDTCWSIAQARGVTVEALLGLGGNEKVDCDRLAVGKGICVPKGGEAI